ncbi:MAG: hypothetical protein ACQEP7_06090 [bacterium]
MELLIVFLGLFLGVLMRTGLPFIRKMKQGKIKTFEYKYLIQAAGALLFAFLAMVLLYPYYIYEPPEILDLQTGVNLFVSAFVFGFASNTLLNELLEWNDKSAG